MLFHLFNALREQLPGANVFRYVSTRIGLATLTALLITFLVAPWFIRRARARQLGEVIRDDGPAGARLEEGDADDGRRAHHHGAGGRHGAVVRPAQHAGLAGAAGHRGLRRHRLRRRLPEDVAKNKKGLPGKLKLLGQFVIGARGDGLAVHSDALPPGRAAAAGAAAGQLPAHVAGVHRWTTLPLYGYIAFAVFVLMAESNAVNLTDGLDGLAIGPVIICSFTFLFLSYAAGTTLRDFNIAEYLGMPHVPGAGELAVFCGAMGGAGIGFLWFNTHPAQVFMGDVGALALGGALGFVALATKTELALPIIGGVFVAEAVSDIIQVAYYKKTKKRVFLMAPIHHHFEKLGWPESRIVVRFWIVSFACAILG